MKHFSTQIMLGAMLLGPICFIALIGSVWTPHDPLLLSFQNRLAPPSFHFWLGTDEFGRDVLSRLMIGATTSAIISIVSVCIAVTFGTLFGVVAGFFRGPTDIAISSFTNALLAFPGILLALGLLTVIGPNKYGIIIALGIAYMPLVTRIVRGVVLGLREREFIEASEVMGNSGRYTMYRHILPNCTAPLTALATSMFGWAVLAESALSFLGLGVPPPAPTWGNMLAASRQYIDQAPWLAIFPGLAITLTLLGINLFGDALRDRLDPRMRGGK